MDISERYQEHRTTGLRYGIIEVTTRCQFRCPGCYMVTRQALNKGEMSLGQTIHVLDLCRDFRGSELETMDILGGEPLMWSPLKSYVKELIRRDIQPWIFTNMLDITPELAAWLYERRVHITGKLNIAKPSDPDQMRLQADMLGSNPIAAKRMIAAIDIFLRAGYRDPLFRLQNLIRRENIHLIPDFIRFCRAKEVGVDLELMGSGEAVGPKYWETAPTPQQLASMIRELNRQGREYMRSYGSAMDDGLWPEFDNPAGKLLMPHVFGSCPFYDKGLYFTVDGTIRACSNSTQTLATIKDPNPIGKAWNSKLLTCRRALTQTMVGEPCHSCDRWEKCRGGCRATVEGMGNPYGGYALCPLPYI